MKMLNKLSTINNLNAVWNSLETERIRYKECGEEEEANNAWIERSIVEMHIKFRNVFQLLKDKKYYDAWCEAEEVELLANQIKRNSIINFEYIKPIVNQIRLLQSLYPYRLFFSSVIDIKEEVCSICGAIRSFETWCGHETGMLYNGELCYNEVTKCEIKSIDIVMNPVNKYAVVFNSNDKGEQKDKYDYRLVRGLMRYWNGPYQTWTYKIDTYKKKIIFQMQPL